MLIADEFDQIGLHGVWDHTFIPCLQTEGSAAILITTPKSNYGPMTQLSTLKMPDGTPIFTCAFIGLVCSKCESFGLVLCPHLESRRSPWLDESRSTDMVNQLYGKNKALMLRETAAIDVGEDNCAFSEDMITKFKNNPLFSDELKNGEFKYIVTFCDPSGGRSQMALVSTIYCRQMIIVSVLFYLLLHGEVLS